MQISVASQAICFKHSSTFLWVKPKNLFVDITFYLHQQIDEFPIFKSLRQSKNRVAHAVRLEKVSEVNKQILHWIKQSYELTQS